MGGSKITLDNMGIKLEAMTIKSSAQMQSETSGGLSAKLSSGVQTVVTGAMVLINSGG